MKLRHRKKSKRSSRRMLKLRYARGIRIPGIKI